MWTRNERKTSYNKTLKKFFNQIKNQNLLLIFLLKGKCIYICSCTWSVKKRKEKVVEAGIESESKCRSHDAEQNPEYVSYIFLLACNRL